MTTSETSPPSTRPSISWGSWTLWGTFTWLRPRPLAATCAGLLVGCDSDAPPARPHVPPEITRRESNTVTVEPGFHASLPARWPLGSTAMLSVTLARDGSVVVAHTAPDEPIPESHVAAFGSDGAPRWEIDVASEITDVDASLDGLVLLAAEPVTPEAREGPAPRVIALDAADGAVRWEYLRDLPIVGRSALAVSPDHQTIVMATGTIDTTSLAGLDPRGALLWSADTTGGLLQLGAQSDGPLVLVRARDAFLRAFTWTGDRRTAEPSRALGAQVERAAIGSQGHYVASRDDLAHISRSGERLATVAIGSPGRWPIVALAPWDGGVVVAAIEVTLLANAVRERRTHLLGIDVEGSMRFQHVLRTSNTDELSLIDMHARDDRLAWTATDGVGGFFGVVELPMP